MGERLNHLIAEVRLRCRSRGASKKDYRAVSKECEKASKSKKSEMTRLQILVQPRVNFSMIPSSNLNDSFDFDNGKPSVLDEFPGSDAPPYEFYRFPEASLGFF